MSTVWAKTRITLEMIKWEHSIFALPFALVREYRNRRIETATEVRGI